MAINKFDKINNALTEKKFENGLSKFEQGNCKCTLTEKGYRIYRTPNVTYDSSNSSTRTMWGGLIIQPFTGDDNFLVKSHTYILLFHVSGQSTNDIQNPYWSNNAGWGGGSYGLTTSPTNVSYNKIGTNFKGEKDMYYKFTVSDDIIKTCTKTYSSFNEGTQYNCYRDFKFGFDYATTGELGTDLYITNFRCYDITTNALSHISIGKDGVITSDLFVEDNVIPQIHSTNEIAVREFIEW